MRLRRTFTNMALQAFRLGHFAGGRTQRGCRAVLDELDLQQTRDTFQGRRIDPTATAVGDDDTERARYNFHQFVAQHIGPSCPIDYLEFGVYKGYILGLWTEMNTHAASRFIGFDSFEGLPSHWKGGEWGSQGSFSTNGHLPSVGDNRASFQKGWFDQTVPPFMATFRPKSRLVVHLDADMYLSTMLPLVHLGPLMKPGTMLLFDEFLHRGDEFKAWQDFRRIFPSLRFNGIAQANHFAQVCFEVMATNEDRQAPTSQTGAACVPSGKP